MKDINKIRQKTIEDFSNQWIKQNSLEKGFWTDSKWMVNLCNGIFDLSKINNKIICEVGSGSGRIVKMLSKFKPKKIHSIEPSKNVHILKNNLKNLNNIKIHNVKGEEFRLKDVDYIFSIGVLHHIIEPANTLKNIHKSLRNKGELIVWLYGYEGNEIYYFIYKLFSLFTTKMNDTVLDYFCNFLNVMLIPYIYISRLSRFFPMHSYLKNIFSKCSFKHRKFIIFDQLNPTYAKYYKKEECLDLLRAAGFKNILIKRHHNYSWVLKGTK